MHSSAMAEAALSALTGLGFSRALAARALELEGGNVERAANMLLTNPPPLADAPVIIDDDIEVEVGRGGRNIVQRPPRNDDSPASVLIAMGFDPNAAAQALSRAQGDLEAAMESLLGALPQEQLLPSASAMSHHADVGVEADSVSHIAPHSVLCTAHGGIPSRGADAAACPPTARDNKRRREEDDSPGKKRRRHKAEGFTPAAVAPSSASAASSSRDAQQEPQREHKRSAWAAVTSTLGFSRSNTDASQAKPAEKVYTVSHLSSNLQFGPRAFGQLRRNGDAPKMQEKGRINVKKLVEASVSGVKQMTGERNQKYVAQMLADCHDHGLHMHGPSSSPVNSQVIPALRHVCVELNKLPPNDAKRVSSLTALAHACQDCQQVQAREVLRIYGDLTSQNDTFEGQLMYSLVRQKEASLDRYISRHHGDCDKDHTQVHPWQQRAHLISGYVALIGDQFGFDGVTAAHSDRFLPQVKGELGHPNARTVMAELRQDMCPKEWLQTLLADINNQTAGSDRLINRDCIFKWVQANMSTEAAHLVFYDEDRSPEFEDLDPKAPLDENQYQPFVSPTVLVDMLLKANMLERTSTAHRKR